MCGIWALINNSSTSAKPDISRYLADFWAIQKRGPDNSCFETFNNVWIGFHRLAIMDTTFQSNQPFIFQERNKTVVFICNGEIYNFKDLIANHQLDIKTNSDCMTIPKLYLKYDESTWLKLFDREIKGEFAFLLLEFDHLKTLTKVYAGRDQIGIRPLYYHKPTDESTTLIFSSEIKGTTTFKDEVIEFPPGFVSRFDIDPFSKITMNDYSFKWVYDVKPVMKTEEKYLRNIRNAIINAVKRRLDADRPVAFLLSGGVDSSLVCAIANKLLKEPIKTFCCGMKGGTDLVYAKMVADHIGSNHTEVYFTAEEGLDAIEDIVNCTETWDTTTVRASTGQFMVCKYIGTKTDCKVVLVGEGPDEVCSSYLFNWYAPDGEAIDKTAKEYVDKIHYFDSRRGDRCISYWGMEGRVPLLDPEVIEAYWQLPAEYRHPKYKGIEKWWLRKAFDGMDLLPNEVLWRKKEAFSDGVSSKEKSWYAIIQDKATDIVSDEMLRDAVKMFPYNTPKTKESYYFRMLFVKHFGFNRQTVLPHYWLPRYNKDGEEVREYMDPSARVLGVYSE
jgi:asparagine synthase (glutamine-hydrolysing)